MKKILAILIISVLLSGGIGAATSPDEDNGQEKMEFYFSKLSICENNDDIALELNGTNSVLMKKNHYMVPTHVQTFTFPLGTKIIDIECTPKKIHRETITKELMISPEPNIAGQIGFNTNIQRNVNPMTTNTWYEYDVGRGIKGNERSVFVHVQVYPVQYHPSESSVEWAEKIELEIRYKEPENPVLFNDEYAFIVIAPAEFSGELENLINHKNSKGVSTKLITLDDLYGSIYFPVEGRDDPEKIKYFIKNAIENWGTHDVLLVGSSSKFPTRTTHIRIEDHDDEELFASDLYYADIYDNKGNFSSWDSNENNVFGEYNWGNSHLTDDVDLHPDVNLGRLACVDEDEVATSVNKIITYETSDVYTKTWFSNIVVVGGDSFTSDPYYDELSGVDEGELVNEKVIEIMDGFTPDRIWVTNGKLSGLNGVGNLNDAINKGAGFIDFSGHGNPIVWATHPHNGSHNVWLPTPTAGYRNYHVAALSNGDKLPIVVTGACSTNKFTESDDCFGWTYVSNPNGGGIATFGATALGYAYLGRFVTYGLVEKMAINTFEAYRQQGALTLGEMWSDTINSYIYAGMDDTDYKSIEEWELFGDPTLSVPEVLQAPEKPETPSGPTSGKINEEHTYTTSTTDPDGDKIYYLFDWDDGTDSGWVGPYNSGETARASHTWTKKGNYQIKVKAKDEFDIESVWSDPLPIRMPRAIENQFLTIIERIFHWLEQMFR